MRKQMFAVIALAMVMLISGCDLTAKTWDDPLPGPAIFDFEAADAVVDFPDLLNDFDEEAVTSPGENVRVFWADDSTRVYFLDINLHKLEGYTAQAIADAIDANEPVQSLGYIVTDAYENTIVVTSYWWPGLIGHIDDIVTEEIEYYRLQ